MKILHTSDWHLGKRLFKLDRSEEHQLFLNWLLETLIIREIDLLLIAGDIFDTQNPPHHALEAFFDFLHRVSVQTKTQTLMIAGNHDSGQLLNAPAQILTSHRVKVWGRLSSNPEDHWFNFKNLDICAIPFFRSHELLPQGEGDATQALKIYLNKQRSYPQILMFHHLAGIYEAAGSEQAISLSGLDSIPTDLLKNFDYVALGHIHKPQRIAKNIYYSGSPLALRFSEKAPKSVVLIELKDGQLTPSTLPIPVFRNLISINTDEDHYLEDIKNLDISCGLTPMVEVNIKLSSPKIGLIDEIKNLVALKKMDLLSFIPIYENDHIVKPMREKIFSMGPVELFEEFYKSKYPESTGPSEELKKEFKNLLEKIKNAPHSP